jgi:D-serine deaminase-like pyridoxal phosphate-dependent protein
MELNTPCLVVDEAQTRTNITHMAKKIKATGCAMRPHIKTHKSPYWARLQIEAGAAGVTVAKLGEAQVMADGGIEDIFMAYPLIGEGKIARAIALSRQVKRFIVAADSLEGAAGLSRAAVEADTVLELRCEVDTGMRRTGMAYDRAPEIIEAIAKLPGLNVTGIFTFRGALLEGKPAHDLEAAGRQEGALMADLAARLGDRGVNIREVSVGSTPTALPCARVPGVTEVRPGTYVYNDAMQIHYGLCDETECSALLAVTVVSRPAPDLAIVDGGVKVFAADAPLNAPPYHFDRYGICLGHPGIKLSRLSEEHGMADLAPGEDPAIGEVLYFIPNHICTCVNLMDQLWLKKPDGTLEAMAVPGRGKSR